ncbi:O-linked N-acetylglucosamine transferase family protein [Zavarzinia sp. CC-PAN008]|uniref:O-linked N-acetylglucosamine transferase, SPINDLY family protein n=1 Tax=Zavarzinia sp. CC-PAN008 TaxID=3243332 RepID=UPI003F743057
MTTDLDQATALAARGLFDDAAELAQRALERGDPAAHLALARIQNRAGLPADAARTVAVAPVDDPDLAVEGAIAAIANRRPSLALNLAQRVPADGPARGLALRQIGNAHLLLGDPATAVDAWRQALARDPGDRLTASNIAYATAFAPLMTTARVLKVQRGLFPSPGRPTAVARPEERARRLHIGYISASFRSHAAAHVFIPMILRRDPAAIRVTCYSADPRRDAVTVRLRLAVDGWRSLVGLDDSAAARLIAQDAVDVLVDLDGHTAGNRLGVFAWRPAPLQVSAWGYLPGPGTAGIDLLVTDPVLIPGGERPHFRERLLDVSCPTLVEPVAPPATEPRPSAPGSVRLGCFARGEKLSEPLLKAWARILAARPETMLVLKDDLYGDPGVAARLSRLFADAGIDVAARIELQNRQPRAAYLARHAAIDLMLDTWPYSGGVVTLDALSQGVPVVTLRGDQVAARTTASILAMAGQPDLVTTSPDAYVATALSLIDDQARRHTLRADLRHTVPGRLARALDTTARQFHEAMSRQVANWQN